MSKTIYYVAPTTDKPSGGAKALYDHVAILNANGFDAYIVHNKPGYVYKWIVSSAPIVYATPILDVSDDDIVVISEENLKFLEPVKNRRFRKIVFCQNHFYIFKTLAAPDYGLLSTVDNILVSSLQIQKFFKKFFSRYDTKLIPYSISKEVFKPKKKKFVISYMPRKRDFESRFIINMFKLVYEHSGLFEWCVIDMMNEVQTASIMAESSIFLSLNKFEGFGLPPLEAMASGCLVVGFHGWGGLDYATDANGLWAPEDDLLCCVEKLIMAAEIVKNRTPMYTKLVQKAIETSDLYTPNNQTLAVIDFFSKIY